MFRTATTRLFAAAAIPQRTPARMPTSIPTSIPVPAPTPVHLPGRVRRPAPVPAKSGPANTPAPAPVKMDVYKTGPCDLFQQLTVGKGHPLRGLKRMSRVKCARSVRIQNRQKLDRRDRRRWNFVKSSRLMKGG